MAPNPTDFYFYSAMAALFALMIAARAVMDWRARRRDRRHRMTVLQRGERVFVGRDWSLPTWERHETLNTKRRSRTTHGGVVLDCLALLLCSYALLAVLWLFAVGVFAL